MHSSLRSSLAVAAALFTVACGDVETTPPAKHGPCDKPGDPGCPETATLAADQASPAFIAVDDMFVYWTDFGGTDMHGIGSVVRAPIAGGDLTILADKLDQPRGIAVDDQFVYFVTAGDGSIKKVPKNGGKSLLIGAGVSPARIAVDSTSVYYTDAGDGSVWKIGHDGGLGTQVAMNQSTPFAIAVDESGLYWCNINDGSVMHAELDGTGAAPIFAPPMHEQSIGITLDGSSAYFTTPNGVGYGEVRRIGKGGNDAGVLVSDSPVGEVANDDAFLYVSDYDSGAIVKITKADGSMETLFPPGGKQNPVGIAVNDKYVFFANSAIGTVLKIAK